MELGVWLENSKFWRRFEQSLIFRSIGLVSLFKMMYWTKQYVMTWSSINFCSLFVIHQVLLITKFYFVITLTLHKAPSNKFVNHLHRVWWTNCHEEYTHYEYYCTAKIIHRLLPVSKVATHYLWAVYEIVRKCFIISTNHLIG